MSLNIMPPDINYDIICEAIGCYSKSKLHLDHTSKREALVDNNVGGQEK